MSAPLVSHAQIAVLNLSSPDLSLSGQETQLGLPDVGTLNMTDISATFATSGGNVTNQGESEVTARGLAWNITGDPTVSDDTTLNGAGTGLFRVTLTDLEPGTRPYLRAYATNSAGTSYGREVSFVTLDSVTVPDVTTTVPSNISANRADAGGNVTHWGGASVTERGVVWSRSTEPTRDDEFVAEGNGTGSFGVTMIPLRPDTRYNIRAYAINEAGIGYGRIISFETRSVDPDMTVVVAKDGSGDYATVQAAFDGVPRNYTGQYTIYVKNGVYYEKLLLEHDRVNVRLIGENRDSTILTYDDYAGKVGSTSGSYSVSIDADDFIARNITIQNTIPNDGTFSGQQAVALSTNGDRQAFYDCNILGYQDTYFARGSRGTGRIYMNNCLIEGSVDFIFGQNIVVIDSSRIHLNRQGGIITAASTENDSEFGFVFRHSEVTHEEVGFDGRTISSFTLGRPWNNAPQTVFMHTYLPEALDHAGWSSWNIEPRLYGEYKNHGPGSSFLSFRADFSRQLTDEEAIGYTLENIFSKDSHPDFTYDWLPDTTFNMVVNAEYLEGTEEYPTGFELHQNYPNPFNPSTTVGYTLREPSFVDITVHDMLGRRVAVLVNDLKGTGYHELVVNAEGWSNGVYICQMHIGGKSMVRKMLLVK